MKTYAIIAQAPHTPPPQNLPPSSLEQATMVSLLIAAVSGTVAALGTIGNKIWGWFEKQEAADSELNKMLLTTMLDERKQLIEVSREGFQAVTQSLAELKATNEKVARTVHDDVQKGMGGHAAIYRSIADGQARMEQQTQAVHKRLDEFAPVIKALEALLNQYRKGTNNQK